MYVEKNSEYSDRNQLASWAEEPMAFMNALGLMESKTASEIAPEEKCSIEQALIIAEKSVYAHQIGWYQAQSTLEKTEGGWSSFVGVGTVNNKHSRFPIGTTGCIGASLANGDRIWVTGPRWGYSSDWLPVIEQFSNQRFFLKAEWYRPIR